MNKSLIILSLYLVAVAFSSVSFQQQYQESLDLQQTPTNNTNECEQVIFQLMSRNYTGLNANIILDSGKSFNDLGDYMNCNNEKQLRYISNNLKITFNRPVVYDKIEPTTVRFVMGYCLPQVCTSSYLNSISPSIIQRANGAIQNLTAALNISSESGLQFTSFQFYDPIADKPQWTLGSVLSVIIVLFLFSITLIASCFSAYHKRKGERRSRSTVESITGFSMSPNSANPSDSARSSSTSSDSTGENMPQREPQIVQIAVALSFTENFTKLFTVRDPVEAPTNFPLFNGVRVILIIWVVWGHDWWMRLSLMGNYRDLTIEYEKPGMMTYGGSGYYAVDSFFWLAGFLQTVLMIDKLKEKSLSAKIYFGLLSHRWMRIWPTYIICILIYYKIMPHLGEGPIWFNYTNMLKTCDDGNVWKNVFFVDNLFPHGEMGIKYCYGWAWYLSNDMQFFLITPFLLFLFIKRPKYGVFAVLGLLAAALIASISVVASFDYFYNYPSKNLPQEIQSSFMDNYYYLPYARIPPYLIGMLFGFLYTNKISGGNIGNKVGDFISRSPIGQWTCWILGIVLPNWIVLSLIPIQKDASPWAPFWRYMFVVFNKVIFTVGLTCLLGPSIFGSKDLLNQFLSAQIWVPFARIQFAIYLVHLFIIDRNFWALPSLPYLNSVQAIYFFFADVPFVCLAAFFVCQIIETPWANLEKILLQGPPRKHKEINQPLVSKDLEHKAQY